jgi:hypothetical protein
LPLAILVLVPPKGPIDAPANLCLILTIATPTVLAAAPALMPIPSARKPCLGRFPMDANFRVETVGPCNARLAPATQSFRTRLSRETGIVYAPLPPAPSAAKPLIIECSGGPEYPALGEGESYVLDVSYTEAHIRAATPEGAIHDLATFSPLVQPGPDGLTCPAFTFKTARGLLAA